MSKKKKTKPMSEQEVVYPHEKVYVRCRNCASARCHSSAEVAWIDNRACWEIHEVMEEYTTCLDCGYTGDPSWLNAEKKEIEVCPGCLEWQVLEDYVEDLYLCKVCVDGV